MYQSVGQLKDIMFKTHVQTLSIRFSFLLALIFFVYNYRFYHDDAFITLRYVDNFLAGDGIVWNAGEFVQGYTNFLHMILISLLGWIGFDLVIASQVIGISAYVGLCTMVWSFSKTFVEHDSIFRYISLIFVMTASPIIVWSIGGLETVLYSFLVTGHALLILLALNSTDNRRFFIFSGSLVGLSFLTRPDGFVFFTASACWLSWLLLKQKSIKFSNLITYCAAAGITVLPYLTWQLIYYGDIVPNTFYAKSGAPIDFKLDSSFDYLLRYSFSPPFLPILFIGTSIYAAFKGFWNSKMSYLLFIITVYALYLVWTGGDHMQSYRFMVPIIPVMSILVTMSLHGSLKKKDKITFFLMPALLVLMSLQIFLSKLNPSSQDSAAHGGTVVGKYIAEQWPANSLIALSTAGSTPYFAKSNRYIDLLGLNDATISRRKINKIQLRHQHLPGHLKGDGAYVLSRQPDYIILGPAVGTSADDPWFLSDLELNLLPEFHKEYSVNELYLDKNGKQVEKREDSIYLFTYYKRNN